MLLSALLILARELLSGGAVASFYTNVESGSVTASCLPYHDYEYTCAHRSMQFNTLVLFSGNGREVMAIVTDRGPYIPGRTWDLSLACARRLDMLEEDCIRVYAVPLYVVPDSMVQAVLEQLDKGKGVIYGDEQQPNAPGSLDLQRGQCHRWSCDHHWHCRLRLGQNIQGSERLKVEERR